MFQGSFKKVSRVFQGSLQGDSRKFGKASKKKNVKLGLLAEVRGGRGPSRFWGPNLLLGQLSNA